MTLSGRFNEVEALCVPFALSPGGRGPVHKSNSSCLLHPWHVNQSK